MYFLSSFNKLLNSGDNRRLYNSITNKYIGYDHKVENIIEKVLNQQLQKLGDSIQDKFLQIITAELLCRGLIIPDVKRYEELNYLNEISVPKRFCRIYFRVLCFATEFRILEKLCGH